MSGDGNKHKPKYSCITLHGSLILLVYFVVNNIFPTFTIGKAAYVFIVNKPPAPGIDCRMVNITENEGEWTYGTEEGIMTQTDFSYTCTRTCVDETNDEFTLTAQYAMVDSKGTKPADNVDFTPIGTSGKISKEIE